MVIQIRHQLRHIHRQNMNHYQGHNILIIMHQALQLGLNNRHHYLMGHILYRLLSPPLMQHPHLYRRRICKCSYLPLKRRKRIVQ